MRVKLRLRKMCSGMTGSAARVSTKRKAAMETTPTTIRPMISAEPQAYSVPPQVVTRTVEVIARVSRAAPR